MTILVGVGSNTSHQLGNRWTVQAEQEPPVWSKKQEDGGSRVSVEEVLETDGSNPGGIGDLRRGIGQEATLGDERRSMSCQGLDDIGKSCSLLLQTVDSKAHVDVHRSS
jgi:hypothetical protein